MTERPLGLPDYERPPITEVVLGVQFDTLSHFHLPHYGEVWKKFRDQFPEIEEQPALEPVFETFGPSAPLSPAPRIQILEKPPTPRVFFLNAARTMLFQVQRDRLLHNWRGQGNEYPRFEHMLESFADGYKKFEATVNELGKGPIRPNQCEVTYVNSIPFPDDRPFQKIFETFARLAPVPDLGSPEDGKFILRYRIPGADGAPVGRLTTIAEPAWLSNGTRAVQFVLTARGEPDPANLEGTSRFLCAGRASIVQGFTALTTPEMHAEWGRKT